MAVLNSQMKSASQKGESALCGSRSTLFALAQKVDLFQRETRGGITRDFSLLAL